MLYEIGKLDKGTVLQGDICIVGAGAAGLTLAAEFIHSRLKVIILESGGLDHDFSVQALYQGRSAGLPYFPLDSCRLRYFGGSTNHWEGRCRPLDPIDFQPRPWIPHSGWPITYAALEPFYAEAQHLCELAAFDYRASSWLAPGQALLPFAPDKLTNTCWQFSPPTRFGEAYRSAIAGAANIEAYLHASVTRIAVNDAGTEVSHLDVADLAGRRIEVRAKIYVLASGGLENPRLLLASCDQINVGLGNRHDLVGRFFMEHGQTGAAQGILASSAMPLIEPHIFGLRGGRSQGTPIVACLNVSPPSQDRLKIGNVDFLFGTNHIGDGGYAALRRAGRALRAGKWDTALAGELIQALLDFDDTASGLANRFGWFDYHANNGGLIIWAAIEQVPNPQSRVYLGERLDQLDVPEIVLDWQLTALDKRTLAKSYQLVAQELGRLGIARVKLQDWISSSDQWSLEFQGSCHHMGTTRMSSDPRSGVVDPDCRVHDIANLYISGSSVFPTSGSANPTLTIVALALRLARHLQHKLV